MQAFRGRAGGAGLRYTANGTSYTAPTDTAAMSTVRRRKNIFIDQRRIDRVKALLRTETETETVDRALALAEDVAVFEAELERGLTGLIGRGGFTDRFPSSTERR